MLMESLISNIDKILQTIFPPQHRSSRRQSPALSLAHPTLTDTELRHVAGLVRVNHAGEVCAQALYRGQALTARLETVKTQMTEAALEEIDHLAWCELRLQELHSSPSVFNPLWYSASFLLGALAGCAGDKWSLGFVAETEKQVTKHLESHLKQLPPQDTKTQAILLQMHKDEARHEEMANHAGAAVLPDFIKHIMTQTSKFLTKSCYYI